MKKSTHYPRQTIASGFTIVELLIVVVVIAILAAITIVGYNGIQNQAQNAAIQSNLKSVAKLVEIDHSTSGAYPQTAEDINDGNGLPSSDGTNYAYSSNGSAYCIAATSTKTNRTYHISSTSGSIEQNGCEPIITGNILGQWDTGTLPTTVGSGVSYVSNGGFDGRPAIQFNQASGAVSQVRFQFSTATTVAIRAYMQMPSSWPSTPIALMIARFSSTSNAGQFVVAGTAFPGQARLIKADPSATAASSSNGLLSTGTWYRFELQLNQVTGQGRSAVFALASDTPLWNSGWQTVDFGASSYRVEIGPAYTSPTIGQIRVTNILVTDNVTKWIGRAQSD